MKIIGTGKYSSGRPSTVIVDMPIDTWEFIIGVKNSHSVGMERELCPEIKAALRNDATLCRFVEALKPIIKMGAK